MVLWKNKSPSQHYHSMFCCEEHSSLSSDGRTNSCSINDKGKSCVTFLARWSLRWGLCCRTVVLLLCEVSAVPAQASESVPACPILFILFALCVPWLFTAPKLLVLLLLLPWIVILLWFKTDMVATQRGCLWALAEMLAKLIVAAWTRFLRYLGQKAKSINMPYRLFNDNVK